MNTKVTGLRPWERRLVKARSWGFTWKSAVCGVALLCLAGGCGRSETADGSGLKDEVAKLRQEVTQLKDEVARQKDEIREMRRRPEFSGRRMYRDKDALPPFPPAGTNSVARGRRPSREELEAHRKMMQDPEMRKKFEAEQKARMEERRRQHEERRREMEERRRARPAPKADASMQRANYWERL